MPKPTHSHPGGASTVRRRAVIGATVLVVLTALTALLSYLTRDDAPSKAPRATTSSVPDASSKPSFSPPSGSARAVAEPPVTHDPVAFGKAAAAVLWSYDTRHFTQAQYLAGLRGWMTGEAQYADWQSVEDQVPAAQVWQQMHDDGQFAAATVSDGHIPDAFTAALNADPGAIKQAYIYAVTVSGTESIAWNGAPRGGAEDRTTTLAVQCRPATPCALVGVIPNVAP
ncbi:hypothetical protein [Streptomyces silvisoli]|uniref:Secreted protein n=1 Tax=Streptomyces silvisoli TaxID=3034235 RepID=A0ABT5ZQK2_9ACTN|nr:hypothetical protein [Streptomyces silvisoli]MDF3291880.1 hypothetical protein [Streptomyces silvisoli]